MFLYQLLPPYQHLAADLFCYHMLHKKSLTSTQYQVSSITDCTVMSAIHHTTFFFPPPTEQTHHSCRFLQTCSPAWEKPASHRSPIHKPGNYRNLPAVRAGRLAFAILHICQVLDSLVFTDSALILSHTIQEMRHLTFCSIFLLSNHCQVL